MSSSAILSDVSYQVSLGTFNNFINKNIVKTLKRTKGKKHSPCNLQCIYNVFDKKIV
jgi:hypothetical protein